MDEEAINSFCEISGADPHRAKFFLESAGGSLEVALAAFFENSGEEFVDSLPPPEILDSFVVPAGEQGTSVDFDIPPEQIAEDMSKKIATLFDGKKKSGGGSSDEDEDRKGQAFYVGGSEKSGQEILGPPKDKDDPNDLIKKVFRGAKDHGAEELSPEDREQSTKPKHFTGGGYRLGDTEGESSSVAPPPAEPQGAAGGRSEQTVPVKMWKNGFSVGDGPLRDYKDMKAQMFLTSIMAGEIPSELLRQFPHQKIAVDIENHEAEEYKPPPMKPFSGQGQTLGGIVPQMTGAPGTSSPEKTFGRAPVEIPEVEVDPAKPTTTLQIRLADGSRLAIKFNNGHRISDVRDVILRARPDYSDRVFAIMTTYPKKEFEDETQTLEEAGILGAVVVQRLK